MQRPFAVWLLFVVLLLLGLGGIYGGIAMLADPAGHLIRMNEVLPLLPVPDYTLPGLFLLVVMGLLPLALGYALIFRPKWEWAQAICGGKYWAWKGSVGVAAVLLFWLAVQAMLIGFRWPAQFATAVLGGLLLLLVLAPRVREFYRE